MSDPYGQIEIIIVNGFLVQYVHKTANRSLNQFRGFFESQKHWFNMQRCIFAWPRIGAREEGANLQIYKKFSNQVLFLG